MGYIKLDSLVYSLFIALSVVSSDFSVAFNFLSYLSLEDLSSFSLGSSVGSFNNFTMQSGTPSFGFVGFVAYLLYRISFIYFLLSTVGGFYFSNA